MAFLNKSKSEYYVENVIKTGRSKELIQDIEEGDNVKLVLRMNKPVDTIDAERLWFRVISIEGDDFIVELDNDPVYIKTISGTDQLIVHRENILELLR